MDNEEMTVYTVTETMEILKAARNTILKLLKDGTLKGFKVGRDWRIPASELKAFMNGEK